MHRGQIIRGVSEILVFCMSKITNGAIVQHTISCCNITTFIVFDVQYTVSVTPLNVSRKSMFSTYNLDGMYY